MIELIIAYCILTATAYLAWCWVFGPAVLTEGCEEYKQGVRRAHIVMYCVMLLGGFIATIAWALRIVYQAAGN